MTSPSLPDSAPMMFQEAVAAELPVAANKLVFIIGTPVTSAVIEGSSVLIAGWTCGSVTQSIEGATWIDGMSNSTDKLVAELAADADLTAQPCEVTTVVPWIRMPGGRVSLLTMPRAVDVIGSWVAARRSAYVCVADVHSLMCARSDAVHGAALSGAALVTPDGAPIVLMARLAGIAGVRRVCGPELLIEVCALSQAKGWRNYFFGGAPGVAERLAEFLTAQFPGLIVAGLSAPPFGPLSQSDTDRHVAEINAAKPDLVWVGLGCPKQEKWMSANSVALGDAVLVGVGAAFDFHSGRTRRAPEMLRRLGLEWAHRLANEPRRLWKRYLLLGPMFVGLSVLHLATGRIRQEP